MKSTGKNITMEEWYIYSAPMGQKGAGQMLNLSIKALTAYSCLTMKNGGGFTITIYWAHKSESNPIPEEYRGR
ncbi:MAG: hypothetical protein MK198_06440 [Gracilimonas sp.]|uniref:hypothetical protein n=1 Tax=Gracilimonas sp. TaxID=1974203 RepID=UPI00374FE502|nr:hypothetical protein [Gracilimonas sp.]